MRDYLTDLYKNPAAHICLWLLVWIVTDGMKW